MHKLSITHQDKQSDFLLHNAADELMLVSILAGKTYPPVKQIQPKVIMDIGANVGSTSVFFGLTYPQALIYAFEPTTMNFQLLEKNTDTFANIKVFNVGVLDKDVLAPIFFNSKNPGSNSLYPEGRFFEGSEEAQFISLNSFMMDNGVACIDILKIDTEGCEVTILESIVNKIPDISVIYVEYHTKNHGHTITELLSASHQLHHHKLCGGSVGRVDASLIGKISLDEIKIHGQMFLAKNQMIESRHVEVLREYKVPEINIIGDELGEMCWVSNSVSEMQSV